MASILVYAGVRGYKNYQLKRGNSSAERSPKPKRDRKSISSLVIPSVASAHFPVIVEKSNISNLPQFEITTTEETTEYTTSCWPESIEQPSRTAPQPSVMLGLTLCESPSLRTNESCGGDCQSYFEDPLPSDLPGDSSLDRSSEVFEYRGNEGVSEPLSPAPLTVVKRRSSPLPPELTYSSDESEDEPEDHSHAVQATSFLQVPGSVRGLLELEPPPIPPKSPARKLRVASS